jgi:hypothetical protein
VNSYSFYPSSWDYCAVLYKMETLGMDLSVVGIKVVQAKVKVYQLGYCFVKVEIGPHEWDTRVLKGNRPKWNSFHMFTDLGGDKVFCTLYEKHNLVNKEIARCDVHLRDAYHKSRISKPLVRGLDNKGTLTLEFSWNKVPELPTKKPATSHERLSLPASSLLSPLSSPKSLLSPLSSPKSSIAHSKNASLMSKWRDYNASRLIKEGRSADLGECGLVKSPTSLACSTQFYNSKRLTKGSCKGDFCKYILNAPTNPDEDDADYEEIVHKARVIHTGQGTKEAVHFRLEMQLEYLKSEKEKARSSAIRNFVPYKYIFKGRQILKRAGLTHEPETIMDLDVKRLLMSIGHPQGNAEEREELEQKAKQCPYFLYEQVTVCDRCYAIYSELRQCLSKKPNKLKSHRSKPSFEPPSSSRLTKKPAIPTTGPVIRHLLSPTLGASSDQSRFYKSPIGRISKDNLDDLMTDIHHELNPELTSYYTSMTQDYRQRTLQKQRNVESVSYIPAPYQEDLARTSQQFFVIDTLNPIRMKDPKVEGRKTWLKYRTRLNLNIAPNS